MAFNISRELRERLIRFSIGIGICFTMLVLYVWQPNILQQADRNVYDVLLRANGGGDPSPTPALIDLDDASLAEFGQWPWPRHLVAKLVANLTEYGAAAIGLDILLAEPDNASVLSLQKSFQRHFNVNIPLESIPQALHDNDRILATILAQSPSVLGVYARFVGDETPLPENMPPPEGIIEMTAPGGLAPRTHIMTGKGATLPLPELRAVAPLGALNVAQDADGIIRSVPLISQVDGRIMISLALRSLMRGLGTKTLSLIGGPDGLQALRIGKYNVPVTPDGRFMVAFRGPRNYYPTFSAADILNKKIPPEEIQGRVLIVGTSAAGLLDIRATPFDSMYPGAEVHTTVIDAILSKRFIESPAWIPGAQVSSILFLGGLAALMFAMAPAIAYLPILALLAVGAGWGSWVIFQQGIYLSPLYTLITLVALAVTLLAVRFWQEARQKRTLRNAFSRYIAPDMVARIVDVGEAVLVGEERVVTLLFTDIRGFTTLSENLTPDQVVNALNQYFTPMTSIIRSSQGTVDKFIGDAVMAFWNAPLDVPRHPLLAVKSAMQMHVALAELNEVFQEEIGIKLRMGAGVHTGKVYVGNMGSAELLDYTCIGDTVNLASRLEGMCAVYGVGVVTSAETADQCLSYAQGEDALPAEEIPFFIPLDSIRVKGKTLPVEICTPISHEEKALRAEEIELFMQARADYVQGDFITSSQRFTQLKEAFPDSLLYTLYAERTEFLQAEPPENWEGVWTFTKK